MSVTRARRIMAVVVTVACAVGTVGCGRNDVFPAPACSEGGAVLLAAQSVPEASQVPCLDVLPEGWAVRFVRIDQDGTTVRLDSDRAGGDAAELSFRPACDVSDAVRAPSDLRAATRFDRVDQLVPRFRGMRAYVFPGGCARWRFDFDEGVTATESVAIGDALRLVARADLERSVRDDFLDEEL